MRELSSWFSRGYTEVGIDLAGRPQILSSVKFRIKHGYPGWPIDKTRPLWTPSLNTFVCTFVRAAFSGNRGQTESEADETLGGGCKRSTREKGGPTNYGVFAGRGTKFVAKLVQRAKIILVWMLCRWLVSTRESSKCRDFALIVFESKSWRIEKFVSSRKGFFSRRSYR